MIGVEYDKWFDLAKKFVAQYVLTAQATRDYLIVTTEMNRHATQWYMDMNERNAPKFDKEPQE